MKTRLVRGFMGVGGLALCLAMIAGCGGSAPPANPYAVNNSGANPDPAPIDPPGGIAAAPVNPSPAGANIPAQPVTPPPTGQQTPPVANSVTPATTTSAGNSIAATEPRRPLTAARRPDGSSLDPVEPIPTPHSEAQPQFDLTQTGERGLDPGENAIEVPLGRFAGANPQNISVRFGGARSEVIPWKVTPDPMADEYLVPADAKLGIKIPGLSRATQDDSWESRRIRILYPRTGSPFVGLGLNEAPNEVREVWDLRNKSKLGDIKGLGLGNSQLLALSSDGKYFAAKPQFSSIVGIYDVVAEKPVQTIPVKAAGTKLLAFAGSKRLIFDEEDSLQIWSIPDFQQLGTIPVEGGIESSGWSLSPGGKYLVRVDRSGLKPQITFHDLEDSSKAGLLILSETARCQGTAFSQDGTQLAVLWEADGGGSAIQVWDIPTGTLVAEHRLEQTVREQIAPLDSYRGSNLGWFPGGSFLFLFGRGVYDVDEGKLLTNLPTSSPYDIRVLDESRISVIESEELVPMDLSDHFEQAQLAHQQGGIAEDANRPPLTPADRSVATELELGDATALWHVKLSPSGRPNIKLSAKPIDIPAGQIFLASMSAGEQPQALIMYSQDKLRPTPDRTESPSENKVWLERVDLRTGSKRRALPLPFETALVSVSPSGKLMVTQLAQGMNRLDIWSALDGTHKFGFRPYQDRGNSAGRPVDFAEFIDDDHLATVGGERLVVWEVPTGKALYEVTIGTMRPRFTKTRDYLIVADPGLKTLVFLNPLTGETAGVLSMSRYDAETVRSCRVSPDGLSLAAITQRPSGGEFSITDITTGSRLSMFPLPVSAEVIQWMDDGFLLLDGTRLVSIEQHAIVWAYELPLGMHIREAADERHWYMAAEAATDAMFKLCAASLPEEQVLNRVRGEQFRSPVLLEPGGKISLGVNIKSVPGEPDLGRLVTENLTRKLGSAKIEVQSGQPVRLVINGSLKGTGQLLTNDISGSGQVPGGMVVDVPEQQVIWDVIIEHEGEPLWQTRLTTSNIGSYSHNPAWDQSQAETAAEQQTSERMWQNAVAQLLEFDPPKFAFSPTASLGAGKSRLTIRGPITY